MKRKDKITEDDIIIRVKDLVGTILGTPDQGRDLRAAIEKPLKDGERVILDFTGIRGYSVLAVYEAFNWAYTKFGRDGFLEKVKVVYQLTYKGEVGYSARTFLSTIDTERDNSKKR